MNTLRYLKLKKKSKKTRGLIRQTNNSDSRLVGLLNQARNFRSAKGKKTPKETTHVLSAVRVRNTFLEKKM
uniref:Uncharacterized protein n=1 Tax=Glossina morsitans morsitans TaxID=37546 RepID=A0A1B0FBL3_GLOMM